MTRFSLNRCIIAVATLFLFCGCITYSENNISYGIEVPVIGPNDNIIKYSGYDDIQYGVNSVKISDSKKAAYYVSYDVANKIPRWVAYDLTAEELEGTASRKGKNFKPDANVCFSQAEPADYNGSGWTKGHLAPAADFKWSDKAMDDTFYFTNCCPQTDYFNSTSWAKLENRIRKWAKQYGRIYIVTGPIIGKARNGKLGANEITIPDAFYKALLVKDNQTYQAIGFVMYNDDSIQSYVNCSISINELELITGEDFFPLLNDDIEESLIQLDSATLSSVKLYNFLKYSSGVRYPSDFRGLLFNFLSTSAMNSSVSVLKSVPLGMYWRTSPLEFSFAPLSQEWYGLAK